jgi:hypothetical protein|tara:strand:+ start:3726 stop:4004 length:279 start_codon:yes stop_codon:yes gene_type:complete
MSDSKKLERKIAVLEGIIKNVCDNYPFEQCKLCDELFDTDEYSNCPDCPECSGCTETVEQLYHNDSGDMWCKECIEIQHDIDDLMRDYNESR